MGLQSALTTSLTGLQAAETVIDVVGNNVANSGTVGFKESDVLFANQFLRTQSIGSAPNASTGGTNPRQVGLGVKIAAINPDFTQGTIQISSNPLDVAIQGDGFLVVAGFQGEELYTRNGQLQTNSQNQVVTATGNRVLGFTINEDFELVEDITNPVPITIPLGVLVAQATSTAFFTGNLSPSADVGTAGIVSTQPLGDFSVEFPTTDALGGAFDTNDVNIVPAPVTNLTVAASSAGGTLVNDSYQYRVTYFTTSPGTPAGTPSESAPSVAVTFNLVGANGTIDLSNLPVDVPATSIWDGRRIYRSTDDGATFFQVGADQDLVTTTFSDAGLANGAALDDSVLDQQEYSYYVTFYDVSSGTESRPTSLVGPNPITDSSSRIRLDNIPQPATSDFDKIRIYRNIGGNTTDYYLVDTIDPSPGLTTTTYIDSKSDADITMTGNPTLDLLGAKAGPTTLLTDVVVRNGSEFTRPFEVGTLSFTGTKGGRTLATKELTITATTNINELRDFMQQAYGVDTSLATDPAASTMTSGGQLSFTSNTGIENELGADPSAFSMTPAGEESAPIALNFEQTQEAVGAGTTTSFVVFDTLGVPLNVRLTTVRVGQAVGTTGTTYRWFATSDDNEPATGVDTFLASGTLVFDLNGNITSPDDGLAQVSLAHPVQQPLVFNLDFNGISGLAVTNSQNQSVSTMSLTRQDGFPTGTLTSFSITESGLIRGVFSNGAERPLGQVLMAKFANPVGLQQVGTNLYSLGINSGEPIMNTPGNEGLGTLTAGAVELSNTDIGQNLIQLILASTQYRGGARVITTTQQLLDELLNLRR